MGHQVKILVNCPECKHSLMHSEVDIDGCNAIELMAKVGARAGRIFLSQIYGSYNKIIVDVEDISGAVIECSCPHCHQPFPILQRCECKAPIIGLDMKTGGGIKVCSRNGCKKHAVEFETIDEAFNLFRDQDEVGLF